MITPIQEGQIVYLPTVDCDGTILYGKCILKRQTKWDKRGITYTGYWELHYYINANKQIVEYTFKSKTLQGIAKEIESIGGRLEHQLNSKIFKAKSITQSTIAEIESAIEQKICTIIDFENVKTLDVNIIKTIKKLKIKYKQLYLKNIDNILKSKIMGWLNQLPL